MAVSKKSKAIFNKVFETPELLAANLISNFQERRDLRKYLDKSFDLSKKQVREVKDFFKPYCKVSPKWAAYYTSANGYFSPAYIPNDLYYTKIDQHFNSRKLGYGFNDKNYYDKIFNGTNQPQTLVRKINGLIFDTDYKLISIESALQILASQDEVICKPSQESGSGRDISFLKGKDTTVLMSILQDKEYDNYIFQGLIKQHPDLTKIHASSINSIRVCTLLMPEKVYVLSAVLRMGAGGSRVDNATAGANAAFGGISVGINEDGTLKKYSYGYYDGRKSDRHPDGFVFEGYPVPSFNKVVDLVRDAHQRIGNFRLVSWDIAIDQKGEPVLIEANMRKGSINFHQFNNGPLFENVMFETEENQSLTKRILDEVFGVGY